MSKSKKKAAPQPQSFWQTLTSDPKRLWGSIAVVAVVIALGIWAIVCPIGGENTDDPVNEVVQNPIATITMADGGVIRAELYPNVAPNTVANFVTLANEGFYDGLIFHRVIRGFMIQGGDPNGTGTGGPGYSIKGEFSGNGFDNPLKHTRGVLSMARSQNVNSAGSQFFVMHADAPHLDGQYAAFGRVIEGMDVVDRIATTRTGTNDRPIENQTMKSVRVETFGTTYVVTKNG